MPEVKTSPLKRFQAPRKPIVTTSMEPVQSLDAATPGYAQVSMPPRPKSRSNVMRTVMIFLALIVLAGFAGYFFSNPGALAAFRKQESFHAVFLNTGQAFFGTIVSENDRNLVLDNVFYLQILDEVVPAAEEGGAPQTVQRQKLVRKGEEPYVPENRIRINREQVVMIEKLSEQSPLLQEIRQKMGSQP
jgi:hypothetical protein